jgi:MerR family redox-sensitive transcriptional activator SoxR
MRIGELSRRAGIPATALRYWEQVGLMPRPARVSGRREYGEDALDRIGLLLLARACGFTLRETRQLFAPELDGKPPPARWGMLASVKLAEIERVERLLARMRTALETVRRCQCIDLSACGAWARRELGTSPPRRPSRARARRSGRVARPAAPW